MDNYHCVETSNGHEVEVQTSNGKSVTELNQLDISAIVVPTKAINFPRCQNDSCLPNKTSYFSNHGTCVLVLTAK